MLGPRSSAHDPGAGGLTFRIRHRRSVLGSLVGFLVLTVMAVSAPAAMADPWACDGQGYVVQYPSGSTTSVLQRMVQQPDGSFVPTTLGSFPAQLNALGFRVQDGQMYAFNFANQNVVRIGRDAADNATFQNIGVPVGLPLNFRTFIGVVLQDGTYFVEGSVGGSTQWLAYRIDVTTSPPVATPVTVTYRNDPDRFINADLSVSPVDGRLYAGMGEFDANGDPVSLGIYELILTGNTISLGPRVADGPGAGAEWFSPEGPAGTLYQWAGGGGGSTPGMFATDMATGMARRVGDSPAGVGPADGASCANTVDLIKDADPRTVLAGTELAYTYTITARGLVDNPVDFVDQLPAGLTYVPGGVTINGTFGSPNAYGGTGTLSISGTIPRNTTVTITARVRVSPDHACDVDVDNQATATMRAAGLPDVTVRSDDPDTLNENDDDTTIHVVCQADVGIVKTASTSPVVPGEDATFQFVATNNGPSTASNVAITDRLPADFSFQSASQGCTESGGTLTCTVGTLGVGQSQTFTVTGRVASSLDECLGNTATVTSTTPDPNGGNNSSTVCPPIEGRSDLSITKDPSRTSMPAGGGQVMYTLVVRNLGPSDDPNAKVSDPLAPGLTLASAEPSQGTCSTADNQVSCELGTLRDGGSAQVLVTVNTTGTPGCITNVARVQGAREDPTPENNVDSAAVCVPPGPPPPPPPPFDLVVSKSVNDRTALVGQRLTYRLVVRNNGPGAAPSARLTDTLNARVRVVSVRAGQGSCTRRIPMTCELGTIDAGDTVTIRIVVKHREATGCSPRQRNAASVTGEGTDSNPANNLDTVDVCIREIPRLTITKAANREVVRGGETFGYRIRVRNPSRGEARNVRVCDRLPSGLRFVGSAPRSTRQGRQRCWTIRTLGAGKSRTFRVTVRAARGAIGRKINTATASSGDVRRRARARDRVQVLGQRTPVTG
jgi:uncharacterized repeat protein (TIGR01451 family)